MTLSLQEIVNSLQKKRFDDIYVSNNLCHLKGTGEDIDPSPVPNDVADVLRPALMSACMEREKSAGSTNDYADFAIDFYGMRFRVAKLPSLHGVAYVLRRFSKEVPNIDALGFEDFILRRLRTLKMKGMIIFSGSTGSGKTTSMSALIVDILKREGGVCTAIEDPPEMPLEGRHGRGYCYQVPVKGNDFASPCKGMLRWHPDYIFLGEIRDGISAVEALKAAISGHLVLATVHAESIGTTIGRLHSLACDHVEPESAANMISQGLTAVIHQEMEDVVGHRRVKRKFLWLGGAREESLGIRSNIDKKNFKFLDAEAVSQEPRFKARDK